MRVPVFEHEKMLTTTDFIFSYLRLQAKREYSILLEGQMFERMTQDGHERGSPPRMKTPFQKSSQYRLFLSYRDLPKRLLMCGRTWQYGIISFREE